MPAAHGSDRIEGTICNTSEKRVRFGPHRSLVIPKVRVRVRVRVNVNVMIRIKCVVHAGTGSIAFDAFCQKSGWFEETKPTRDSKFKRPKTTTSWGFPRLGSFSPMLTI